MAPPSYYPILELLLRQGVEHRCANDAALNDFAGWSTKFMAEFWDRVKRPRLDFCPCRDPFPEKQRAWNQPLEPKKKATAEDEEWGLNADKWLSNVFGPSPTWIKAPRKLMEQAVKEDKALCLNAKGAWSLRSEGYMALSHVWVEGIQTDPHGRGFEKKQLTRIFDIIKKTGAEWIWTDVLAIPGGGGVTSTVADEVLKIDIINTMDKVYSRADAVIILDALTLQLHPQTSLDVAIALRCGKWITRQWTYQEIKLAHKALIVTAGGIQDYGELIQKLESVATDETPHMKKLRNTFARSQRRDDLGISIPDIAMACRTRKAGLDLDYARALFPVLGLKWEMGMTREQGMARIYTYDRRQQVHTSRIATFHGCPRLTIRPAWAPSYLAGLEGEVGTGGKVEQRGLRGEWYALKVKKISDKFNRLKELVYNLELDGDQASEIQCVLAESESDATKKGLENAIGLGLVYLLSESPSAKTVATGFSRTVMMVEQALTIEGAEFEVFVYCTAVVRTPTIFKEEKLSVLLRNEGPLEDEGAFNVEGRLASQLRWNFQFHDGESPLHKLVRAGQLDPVRQLLEEGSASLTARDSKDWTPLHTAAALDRVEILELLLPKSKENMEDLLGSTGHKDHGFTLLSIAAEHGGVKVIERLLQEEPEQIVLDNSVLMAAKEHQAEAVELLLGAGADVNFKDVLSGSPLLGACAMNGYRLATMEVLLKAGADPNASDYQGQTSLHIVAEKASEDEVSLLLSHGAQVDARMDKNARTPLRNAIVAHKEESVRLLLDHGADHNAVFDGNRTPIFVAAGNGNYKVLQMILEKPVDVNVKIDDYGWTPLRVAASAGDRIMVRILLEAGADVNARDGEGATALTVALKAGHKDVADVLRTAGGVE